MIEGSEIGLIPADRRGFDGPAERAGEAEVACRLALTIGRKPTDMPEDSGAGIVRRTRAEAGFLGHACARDAGPGPLAPERSRFLPGVTQDLDCRAQSRTVSPDPAPDRGKAAFAFTPAGLAAGATVRSKGAGRRTEVAPHQGGECELRAATRMSLPCRRRNAATSFPGRRTNCRLTPIGSFHNLGGPTKFRGTHALEGDRGKRLCRRAQDRRASLGGTGSGGCRQDVRPTRRRIRQRRCDPGRHGKPRPGAGKPGHQGGLQIICHRKTRP